MHDANLKIINYLFDWMAGHIFAHSLIFEHETQIKKGLLCDRTVQIEGRKTGDIEKEMVSTGRLHFRRTSEKYNSGLLESQSTAT
jgi:hypothetical protein